MAEKKQIDMPFHVYTNSGTFHSGYENVDQCDSAVREANKEAESMGLTTRYVSRAK